MAAWLHSNAELSGVQRKTRVQLFLCASAHTGSLSHLLPIKAKRKRAAFMLLISCGFNHESISSVA